jgi:hypothetical protein
MWLRRSEFRRLLADLAEARASVWRWSAMYHDVRIDNELLRAEVEKLTGAS